MIRPLSLRFIALAALLFAAGCKREQIRVYVAPREAPETAKDDAPPGKIEGPQIAWQLPDGWRETEPSSVSLASFALPPAAGGEATVNIAQLPSMKGREADILNMWRMQVGLGSMTDAESVQALSPATVAGVAGQSFEVVSTREGKPTRIVTALLHRPEGSWFFKLSGDDAAVTAHKAVFFAFAKGIRFVEGEAPPAQASAPTAPPPSAPENAAPQFKWALPEGWKTLAPGQMQVAKFAVPEKDGAKAEVAVSIFPSDTGGTLANVNRWRAQLGFEATDEAGLKDCTQPLDGGAVLVDLAKEQRQLIGAIVPREGRWWFYKMLGDAPAVASAKEAFVQFVKTAP